MPLITHLLYLHGFRSSPKSFKAQMMGRHIAQLPGTPVTWACPQLPPSPQEAIALIRATTHDWPAGTMAVVGSSLGGFYATVLAEDGAAPAIATVMVGGKARKIDVSAQVGVGCEALLQKAFEMTRELISRADPDTVAELLRNVIVTGGGSLIRGFGVALQAKLLEEGFDSPQVRVLGENYKDFVAAGALKVARMARENQWQTLLG